ncbi:MAG: ZIP family metal transporter [bacterium]|nr:ZIP family metal transporter [bacterium]
MTLIYILIATFLISIIAFIGVLTLFFKKEILDKILLALVSFSAGALIGGAFLHLLPEAIIKLGAEEGEILKVFLFLIFGFSFFFILEQFISWHHDHECVSCEKVAPFSYLVLISDGIHNFVDGLVIAASFIVSFPMGLVTTLAVAFHEIPQELGDFGVLVYGGMKRSRALFLNFLSALVAVAGGIIGFFLSEEIGNSAVFLLPFAAGNFIYIAASDLIPEIKKKKLSQDSLLCFFIFLLGIILMLLFKFL